MLRLITTALLIVCVGSAAAQVTGALTPANPRLKEKVIVSNDVVRIGDLVDNAGSVAEIPVFRSPDLGYTGGVPLARVVEALAPYKMAALDTGTITEVMVTRTSRAITAKQIEARIARALASQYGFGDAMNVTITFERDIRTIHVEPSAIEELQIARLNLEPRTGRFFAVLELPGSVIARRLGLRFSGSAVETVEATVLTRALSRGEVIKPPDVTTQRRPKADIVDDTIAPETAVGLAAKRSLRSGSVLRQDDLAKPETVQRNETVTIIYEVPGFLLTARGKALEAGAIGDLVNVLNTQSNRTVQATVMAPGRVSVAATIRSTVTNASTPDSSNAPTPSAQ